MSQDNKLFSVIIVLVILFHVGLYFGGIWFLCKWGFGSLGIIPYYLGLPILTFKQGIIFSIYEFLITLFFGWLYRKDIRVQFKVKDKWVGLKEAFAFK